MCLKFLPLDSSKFKQTKECCLSLRKSFWDASKPEVSYATISYYNALSAESLEKNRSSFYFSSVSSSNLKLKQNRTKKPYSNRELFLKRGNTKPSSCTCQLYQKQYFEKRLRMASEQFLSFQKQLMVTACRNKKHCQKTVHIRNYLLCSKTF